MEGFVEGDSGVEAIVEVVVEGEWEVVVRIEGGVAGGAEMEVWGVEDVLWWGAVKWSRTACGGCTCGGGWLGRWEVGGRKKEGWCCGRR